MAAKLHGATIIGSSIDLSMSNGAITSSGTMTLTSDGYLSILSPTGGIAIGSDGGDLNLTASAPAGADIVLSTVSGGEVAVRTALRQYGTAGTISMDNTYINGNTDINLVAATGTASVAGFGATVITSGTGNVTLSGTNILISGELDTASGNLTVKANNGSSDVAITSPTATGRAGQPGLVVTGGSSSANGITVTGGSTNGNGIVSTASGSGTGITGASSTGYGVIASTDTSEPTTAAFRIVPQDTDPSSSPAMGDIYVSSKSGLMSVHHGDGYWGRTVTKIRSIHFAITEDMDPDTSENLVSYSIPAGALRQGSTIRLLIAGTASSAVGLPSFNIVVGGVTGTTSQQLTNSTNRFLIRSDMTVRAVGSSGIVQAVTSYDTLNLSTYSNRFFNDTYSSVNTNSAVTVTLLAGAAEGGANITIHQFTLDITD